ncbi:Histidine kinase-, DNA gyrase B-, and HSP90-like ATPase [Desulfoluna spongiiphila]|uniref:Histidine kinase-, DNA gyrase B-, and HSP90-like ATPase n=2 Tax=Desulfoluna spongiiphila TaxID=419481 RepID=A0A1G5FI60_9BACT|nr:Histidine kinase-, DNA gyrase B-, and HSP90-like ATPase [Desulfoluna spongiiphila]
MNACPQAIERQWLWIYRKTRMVDFLLSGTPILPGDPFTMESMVKGLFSQLRDMAAPDVGLFFEGPMDAAPLTVNRDAVDLLVYLILENALRFTSNGCIQITHHSMKQWDRLTIRDTGTGFTPRRLHRLNDTLRRGHPDPHPGSIRGIPLSASLIQSLGGRMGIRSRQGKGSSVSLFFSKGGGLVKKARQHRPRWYPRLPPFPKQGFPLAHGHGQTLCRHLGNERHSPPPQKQPRCVGCSSLSG